MWVNVLPLQNYAFRNFLILTYSSYVFWKTVTFWVRNMSNVRSRNALGAVTAARSHACSSITDITIIWNSNSLNNLKFAILLLTEKCYQYTGTLFILASFLSHFHPHWSNYLQWMVLELFSYKVHVQPWLNTYNKGWAS